MIAGRSRRYGNFSKPNTPAQGNAAATKLWAERAGTAAPTRDAPSAKMTPEQINKMNATFWAAR
jgi:hypothetical protein